jgi:acetyl esterase/lipase
MRIVLLTLALLCSGFAVFATMWIVVPALTGWLWALSVGASEWSIWLGLLGLLGAILSVAARSAGSRWVWGIALVLGVIAVVLAAVPPLQAIGVARANEVPLSLTRYVRGLNLPTITPQEVVFATVNDQPLALDVYRSQASDEARPAVIVVHGGSWRGGRKSDFPRWNEWLVAQGYTVFDIAYRLEPQPNWQTATGDVKCAIGWVKQNAAQYNIDPDQIALLGRSAGGHLALLAAYTPNEPQLPPSCAAPDTTVQAVVSFYGPTDLLWGYNAPANPNVIDGSDTLRRFLGGPPDTAPSAFNIASPVNHVGSNTPPTLLLHGGRDQLVGQQHTEFLTTELAAANVPHRTVIIPYGQHGFDYNFNGWSSQIVQPILRQFLQEYLEPQMNTDTHG